MSIRQYFKKLVLPTANDKDIEEESKATTNKCSLNDYLEIPIIRDVENIGHSINYSIFANFALSSAE